MNRSPEQIYDELLVLRCQDGERDAWSELAERWQERLHRHAWRLAATHEVASDAVQEAWLAIVRNIRKLDDPALFPAWAYRIVTHKCTDQVRRAVRRSKFDAELSQQPPATPADNDAFAEDDDITTIRRAMLQLPSDRRALLGLHYLEGVSIHEIASILSIPEGTVKSRLFTARKALKKALDLQIQERNQR
ncbi:MAG: RNA polymerase sigma factor [Deltaproteobacteria bacterium]|nr:RNA polymerase sigma factor [Deltaproteobacteria bacterium]